jgi:hypothetical protein
MADQEIAVVLKLLAQQFQSGLKDAESSLGSLSSSIAKFATDWKTGAAAAVTAIAAIVRTTQEAATHIEDLSQQTGLSTTAIQEWNVAFRRAGLDADEFVVAMRHLSQTMGEARAGNEESKRFFQLFGIDVNDAATKAGGTEPIFRKLFEGISQYADGFEKGDLAVKAFGRSGLAFIPIMNGGIKALDDAKQKAHDLNTVLGRESVEELAKANRAFKDLESALLGFKNSLGAAFGGGGGWLSTGAQQFTSAMTTIVQAMHFMAGSAQIDMAVTAQAISQGLLNPTKEMLAEAEKLKIALAARISGIEMPKEGAGAGKIGAPGFRTPAEAAKQAESMAQAYKIGDEAFKNSLDILSKGTALKVALLGQQTLASEVNHLSEAEGAKAEAKIYFEELEQTKTSIAAQTALLNKYYADRIKLGFDKDEQGRENEEKKLAFILDFQQKAQELEKRRIDAGLAAQTKAAQLGITIMKGEAAEREAAGMAALAAPKKWFAEIDRQIAAAKAKLAELKDAVRFTGTAAEMGFGRGVAPQGVPLSAAAEAEVKRLEAQRQEIANLETNIKLQEAVVKLLTTQRADDEAMVEANNKLNALLRQRTALIQLPAKGTPFEPLQGQQTTAELGEQARQNALVEATARLNTKKYELEGLQALDRQGLGDYQATRQKETEVLMVEQNIQLLNFKGNAAETTAFGIKESNTLNESKKKADNGFFENYIAGLREYAQRTGDGFNLANQMAQQTAQSMSQAFGQFFFDYMDGKIQTFKDAMRSLLALVKQIVSQIIAQLVTAIAFKAILAAVGGSSGGELVPNAGGGLGGARGGLVARRFAMGGPVFSNGDSVPAWLTPGEFVISNKGMDALNRLNQGNLGVGGAPNVTVNLIGMNQQQKPQVNVYQQMRGLVIDIISREKNTNPYGPLGSFA